ncbi:hypothetical protein L1887_30352 [Cichorium endivia]|nr:hypothetical protein L1887_30352 [Cichorium endivia]
MDHTLNLFWVKRGRYPTLHATSIHSLPVSFFNTRPLPSHTQKLLGSICHTPTTVAFDIRLIIRPSRRKFRPTIQRFLQISGSNTVTNTRCICVIQIPISDLLISQILGNSETS